ncbi:site-specific integrase [Nostoc sp. UHCC 0702]|nr:site-specific integrase [Nostoc sp. UHCC 0702]
MTNSAKTPSGKARKGQVAVRPDSGSIKACFPRNYCCDGKQIKLATSINPDDWEATASKLQRRLQLELEEGKLDDGHGNFNAGRYQEILQEYGLKGNLRIVKSAVASSSDDQVPPKPQLSLMEVWDMYCEYRKRELRESVYVKDYQGRYKSFLQSAIKATKSEDALKIRNWLVENRNHQDVKKLLSNLSEAYQMGMRNRLLTHNPYDGMAEGMQKVGAKGKTQKELEADNDVLDKSKAYTWNEAQIILDYTRENYPHWYNFLKFKFHTGCRSGEVSALMWCDVDWNKQLVYIRRTYDRVTKKFYPLKNDRTYKGGEKRDFPMPKDGELWNVLKSIPQGEDNDIVFKSKTGRVISHDAFGYTWRGLSYQGITKNKGIIPELIKQGKLTKYLSPYNTRHTFITHAIFDLGIDEKYVAKWCGHAIDVSNKHYQDVALFASRINPEVPMSQQVQQQSKIELLEEQMREQQELIAKLQAQLDNQKQ